MPHPPRKKIGSASTEKPSRTGAGDEGPGRLQELDVWAKILLGVAGLCLSCVLGIGELQEHWRESARKSEEAERLKEESYTREFQAYYALARGESADMDAARTDLDIAGSIAQTLARDFRKPIYRAAVLALRARFSGSTATDPSANSPIDFQAGETANVPGVGSSDEWFAVIGSYSISDAGLRAARVRARSVRATLGCTEIWKTRVSQSYALVVGGKTTQDAALAFAQRARRRDFAPDAFTQVNRQWERVDGCPGPG